jgi:hypothetical protein
MQSKAQNVKDYIKELPKTGNQQWVHFEKPFSKYFCFTEEMSYGMIGYVVPHSIYPDGYHCNPKLPYLLSILHHRILSLYIIWVLYAVLIY